MAPEPRTACLAGTDGNARARPRLAPFNETLFMMLAAICALAIGAARVKMGDRNPPA
jgi:hypothetical protein